MKPFLSIVSRFFRGFLKFILWTVTLIVFFYVEENWRGAHDWAATKAQWEARGESFDYEKLVPPPVPDSQNLGLIPLFKIDLDPNPKLQGLPLPIAMRHALHQENESSQNIDGYTPILSGGSWWKSTLLDFESMNRQIAVLYKKIFPMAPMPNDPLLQFEALYPFIADLQAASSARPFCRFPEDYKYRDSRDPLRQESTITLYLDSIGWILRIHALVALHENRPEVALADIRLLLKISSALTHEPMLEAGLTDYFINEIVVRIINTGTSLHSWNDSQLAELEGSLASLDTLAEYQLSVRGELTGFSIPDIDLTKKLRKHVGNFFGFHSPLQLIANPWCAPSNFWPDGWLDQNKVYFTNLYLKSVALVDPRLHRAFPTQTDELEEDLRRSAHRWDHSAPWKTLLNPFTTFSGSPRDAATFFTQDQIWLDQARIACALERYHLLHGAYPGTLDELAPAFIAEVPHDVINGQPYRYRLQNDGTYLLYSVGWNQKDEGGLVLSNYVNPSDPTDTALFHGDWVWPMLK